MTSVPWAHGPTDFQLSDAGNTWNPAALSLHQAGYEVTNEWDEQTETVTCVARLGNVALRAADWPKLAGLAAIVDTRGAEWGSETAISDVGRAANVYDVFVDLSTAGERWVAKALFEIATSPLPRAELHRYDSSGPLSMLPAESQRALSRGVPRRLRSHGGLIFEALPALAVAPSDEFPMPHNLEFAPDEKLVVFGRSGLDQDLVAVDPGTGHVWSIFELGVNLACASVETFCIGARVMQMALDHAFDLEPLAAIPFVEGVTHQLLAIDPVVPTADGSFWETMA